MTASGAATWIGASRSAFCAGAAGARKVLSQGGAQRARRQPRWKRLEIAAKIWTDDGRRKAAEMLELTLEVRDCPRVTIPSSTVSTSSPACLREHDVRAVLCGFFCFLLNGQKCVQCTKMRLKRALPRERLGFFSLPPTSAPLRIARD